MLKKYLPIVLMSVFVLGAVFSSAIAGAADNTLVKDETSNISKTNGSVNESTNQTTSKSITQPVNKSTSITKPQPSNVTKTTEKVPVAKQKFRVGPTVILRPVTDVVTKGQDGLVELYMDNPTLNDVTLNVDARISVPSGVQVYGQGFGQADAAGTVYGTFSVPPGTVRTININIKGEKVGTYTVHFSGMYWPGDNKDNYNPISLTHPFEIKEASTNTEASSSAGNTEGVKAEGKGSFSIPGFEALVAVVGLLGIYIARRK
jgi:PGF-CTERM protein